MRALLLGDEPRVVINVGRSLLHTGAQVTVGCLSGGRVLRSRCISEYVSLMAEGGDLSVAANRVVELAQAQAFDAIVPCSDTGLRILCEARKRLDASTLVCSADSAAIDRVLDKRVTLEIARQCGIQVPKEYAWDSLEVLESEASAISFPVIAKPHSKYIGSPFKTLILKDISALRAAMHSDLEFGRRNLIQEFVPGFGVGVAMLFDGSTPLATFQHRRLREYPVQGGVSVEAVADPLDPSLSASATALLQAVGWRGVAMVEFRCDPTARRAVLMEVNGRYWGTLALALRAGVDFPAYELEWRRGRAPRQPLYRVGTRMVWVRGMLLRIGQTARGALPVNIARPPILSDVRALFGVLTRPSLDPLWSWSDPLPSLVDALRTVIVGVAEIVRNIARSMLPRSATAIVRELRRLDRSVRGKYLGLRIRYWLGTPIRIGPRRLHAARVILFVCRGNIMRSAFAAAYFEQAIEGSDRTIEVLSGGVRARNGRSAEVGAIEAARRLGVSLVDHRATLLDDRAVRRADAVFVMDYLNLAEVLARFPSAGGKTQLLMTVTGGPDAEVPDPYHAEPATVVRSFERIRAAIDELLQQLRDSH